MKKTVIPGIACLSFLMCGVAGAGEIYRDYSCKVDTKPTCQLTDFNCDPKCDLSNNSCDNKINADCSDQKCDVNIDDSCDKDLCDVNMCCPPPPPCEPPMNCCPKPPPCDPGGNTAVVPLPAASQTAGAALAGMMLIGWIRARRAVKA
jgi:hypothetical protein